MHRYRAIVGVLGALPVFESAARLMSFTKAAAELGLTQPAVSRRIASLEEAVGASVFQRKHNKLELTREGDQILQAVELGLGHINKVVSQLSQRRNQKKLTIACGFSFASMWLQPRFSKFRQMLDDIEVHLIASEFIEDIPMEMVDIRILWKDMGWSNRDMRPLVQRIISPVCSPSFAESNGLSADNSESANKLSEQSLLHYSYSKTGKEDWTEWFRLHGIDYTPPGSTYIFDNFQFAIQAALEGKGVAVGNITLTQRLLASGRLVQVGPRTTLQNNELYIEFEPTRLSKEKRDGIYAWFRKEIEESLREY